MKKYISLFLLFVLFSIEILAQVPAGFSFQTVVRGVDGRLKKNQPVSLVFSLSPGQNANPIWRETKALNTDAFGVATTVVGEGSNQVTGPAQFGAINFGAAEFWLSVHLGSVSANNLIAKQKLLSVPYARYAEYSNNTFPPGIILAYGGDTIPQGWALCDGRVLNGNNNDPASGLSYNRIYNAIKLRWGGSGATSFNLPDLRGRFLRGVSDVDSLDPDRASRFRMTPAGIAGPVVGSYQGDGFQGHRHNAVILYNVGQTGGAAEYGVSPKENAIIENPTAWGCGKPVSDQANGEPRISAETRPKNAYVYYIIKL